MPLLWVLRDTLGLTGTKYGCGQALCGACTVHLAGRAVRSCQTTAQSIAGKQVTTLEGLTADGNHPVQQAWVEGRRTAVRLLPARPDNVGCRVARDDADSYRCRYRSSDAWQHLPVRHDSDIRQAIHRAAEKKGGRA